MVYICTKKINLKQTTMSDTLIMLDKPILVNEEKTEVKYFIKTKNTAK